LAFFFAYFFPILLSGYFSANSLSLRSPSFFLSIDALLFAPFQQGFFAGIRPEMAHDHASRVIFY
jgi:hypothetical protein